MKIQNTLGALVTLILLLGTSSLRAAPFTAGNIIVSQSGFMREYTISGTLVQSFPNPVAPGENGVRDFVVTTDGRLHAYNGTFSPSLSTLNAITGVWTHQSFPEWSTVGATFGGGVASFGNHVFATDMLTFNAEANGLIRFNTANGTAQRFAQGGNIEGEFIDVTLGHDGLLYGLWPGGSPSGNRIDVYDPSTLAFVRTISFSVGFWAIAVNPAGEIFGVNQGGGVWHLAPDGSILGSLQTGKSLSDVDRSASGQLLIGSQQGVFLTDETLSSFTTLAVGQSSFVAFTTPVPEASSVVMVVAVGLFGCGGRRWRAAWGAGGRVSRRGRRLRRRT